MNQPNSESKTIIESASVMEAIVTGMALGEAVMNHRIMQCISATDLVNRECAVSVLQNILMEQSNLEQGVAFEAYVKLLASFEHDTLMRDIDGGLWVQKIVGQELINEIALLIRSTMNIHPSFEGTLQ